MTDEPLDGRGDDQYGRDALRRLIARDAIRELVYRYAWYLDSRDIERLTGLFVEDVQVVARDRADSLYSSTNRQMLAEMFTEQLRNLGPTTLLVGNHIIDFDDDDPMCATGIVYCRGYIQDPIGFIEQMIVYSDQYRCCEDGAWRFVSRRHELFFGVVTAEQPHDQPPANWPQHQVGVGTIPFRLATWQTFMATKPPAASS